MSVGPAFRNLGECMPTVVFRIFLTPKYCRGSKNYSATCVASGEKHGAQAKTFDKSRTDGCRNKKTLIVKQCRNTIICCGMDGYIVPASFRFKRASYTALPAHPNVKGVCRHDHDLNDTQKRLNSRRCANAAPRFDPRAASCDGGCLARLDYGGLNDPSIIVNRVLEAAGLSAPRPLCDDQKDRDQHATVDRQHGQQDGSFKLQPCRMAELRPSVRQVAPDKRRTGCHYDQPAEPGRQTKKKRKTCMNCVGPSVILGDAHT